MVTPGGETRSIATKTDATSGNVRLKLDHDSVSASGVTTRSMYS